MRELEVLRLLALGRSHRGIAEELHVSCETVKAHAAKARVKLDAATSIAAAVTAYRLGLIDLSSSPRVRG